MLADGMMVIEHEKSAPHGLADCNKLPSALGVVKPAPVHRWFTGFRHGISARATPLDVMRMRDALTNRIYSLGILNESTNETRSAEYEFVRMSAAVPQVATKENELGSKFHETAATGGLRRLRIARLCRRLSGPGQGGDRSGRTGLRAKLRRVPRREAQKLRRRARLAQNARRRPRAL